MRHLKHFFLIIALTMPLGAQGQTPDTPTSRMNALSCEPLPAPLETDVQILDNAERFVAFKAQFEKELRSRGVKLSSTAPLIATLDIRTVREFQSETKDPLFEKHAGQDSSNIGQDSTIFMRGNVFSNRGKSILGGAQGRSEKFSLNQLQVSVSINDRTNGRCLWQGEILHDLHGDDDPDAVTPKTFPFLARALGKPVRNRALTIYP
ncbi:MAG: hypothetical protein O3C49_10115 [Proteobacteria bacterium]|nr:hypothetical protein [Pseudomonadota bacterium]MDA1323599.1 hypothetical protein [Pseudomonadota bacterium]